jgi:hypothetical protein
MNIQTTYEHPPIPTTKFDWSAVDSNTYDGDGPIGRGPTEEAAIANLMGMLGATCTEVAEELIGRGFSNGQVAKVMNTTIGETA